MIDLLSAPLNGAQRKNNRKKEGGKKLPADTPVAFQTLIDQSTNAAEAAQRPAVTATDRDCDSIEQLLNNIRSLGIQLLAEGDINSVKRYRQAVSSFFRRIVDSNLHILKQTSSHINPLKKKQYTIIESIDRKIDILARELIKQQKDQLLICAKLEEINGMLVDLLE